MAAWADSSERFVEIPGIVEIRWVSDDPDYYVAPIDLFDEQKNGLPDFYGKKDKTTTEQAFFTCNVCECDLKSVVTLRAHCKGTQHIRKALQKKKEYRMKIKKEAAAMEVKTDGFKTLFEWLDQGTSEAVVGLEHVTEYVSGDDRDIPYYHCDLVHCNEEQGTAEEMKNHIFTARHKQAWLEVKTGSFLKHQTEISQRIAEYTKDFKRDFRDMKLVESREMWNKARERKIRTKRMEDVRVKRENVDAARRFGERRSSEHERDRSPQRGEASKDRSYSREYSGHVKREYTEREYDREPGYKRENSSRRSPDREYHNRGWKSEKFEKDRSPQRNDRKREDSREHSRKQEYTEREPERGPSYQQESSPRRSREQAVDPTMEVEEMYRSGNFDNWSTAMVKVDPGSGQATTSSQNPIVSCISNQQKSVPEEVDRLHRRVAAKVMKNLNRFYPGAEEFESDLYKIGSPEEYSRLAKQFSHKLRRQIKESYQEYNGTLEGIVLTPDNELVIRTEVESYFEKVPRITKW